MDSPVATRHSPTSYQLTPRSKIRALMDAADADSDNERQDGSPMSRKNARAPLAERLNEASITQSGSHRKVQPFVDTSSEDEEIIPQGKLARRLRQGSWHDDGAKQSEEKENDSGDAYSRVKKLLQSKNTATATPNANESPARPTSMNGRAVSSGLVTAPQSPSGTSLTSPKILARQTSSLASSAALTVEPDPAEDGDESLAKDDSETELPDNLLRSKRFEELVAQKRAEREARQAEETAKKAARKRTQDSDSNVPAANESEDSDAEAIQRLTQQQHPARNASKKAREEIARETQRMSRNMQLAHQAKTKKKITKESLLARFNFGGATPVEVEGGTGGLHSVTGSSAPASDQEAAEHETPPTSPMQPPHCDPVDQSPSKVRETLGSKSQKCSALPDPVTEQLPEMGDLLSQPVNADKDEKGKGKPTEVETRSCAMENEVALSPVSKQRPVRIRPPSIRPRTSGTESDGDLEIITSAKPKASRLEVFERLPQVKNVDVRSLRALRALAHLDSPPRKTSRKEKRELSMLEMQRSLQKRAKQQAAEERKAKIEDLKARGIHIQTSDEKQKEQEEVEDLLEKARKENADIREREKKAARLDRLANGDNFAQGDESDEEDGDYEGARNEQSDGSASDSEASRDEGVDEEADDDSSIAEDEVDVEVENSKAKDRVGFFDDEASDDSHGEDESQTEVEDNIEEHEGTRLEDEGILVRERPLIRRRYQAVIEDDEESLAANEGVQHSAHARGLDLEPGDDIPQMFLGRQADAPLGLTQAFQATLADGESDMGTAPPSVDIFEDPPEPLLPSLRPQESLEVFQKTMQPETFEETPNAAESEFPVTGVPIANDSIDELQTQHASTQEFEMPDPTQDAGFILSSPGPDQRFVSEPPSTVATVVIPREEDQNSPVPKKRGRLRRRNAAHESLDDETIPSHDVDESPSREFQQDAFVKMKRLRQKLLEREEFNKKKSDAKNMVEEQAQESEDEYAGLGGASDEESGSEDNDFDRDMIDKADIDIDERKLAAFHADKQRTDDDKAIQKLFKDINNGGLRRKRQSEFDLSDSEDDAAARRQRKQRQFAKMRKALCENENVGKIAEDPKKMAFLKAIEDRDDGEDFDFFDQPAEDSFRVDMETQESESQQNQVHRGTPVVEGQENAEPIQGPQPTTKEMRPPASKRRTPASIARKPTTLAEIRESVSFLVEDPAALNQPPSSSSSVASDSEPENDALDEDETSARNTEDDLSDLSQIPETQPNSQTLPPTKSNPRRTGRTNPIIDRLTLKRQSSSSLSSSTTTAEGGTLAFFAPSASNTFVPSLLRRATTSSLHSLNSNSTTSNTDGSSTGHAATERLAGGAGPSVARKLGAGGQKRSSVNFRKGLEGVKKGVVDRVEKRRRERRQKMARESQDRGGGVGRLSRMGTWDL